jgi:long-subunit acyl-CoA synthetase (AMP-forming)
VYSNVIGEPVVPGSVGKRIRLTESKLSSGDHGEVLVRGPFLFMKWVDNLQTAWNLISSRSYQEVNLTRSFILDTCSIQRRLGDRSTRMAFT